jgi:hypothetical protein
MTYIILLKEHPFQDLQNSEQLTIKDEHQEVQMPHYLQQVAYSIEGWKALVKKPQNRIEAVRPAIASLAERSSTLGSRLGTTMLC